MCIEVDDIKKAIEDVKDRVRPLTSEPKVGYSVRVSWVYYRVCRYLIIGFDIYDSLIINNNYFDNNDLILIFCILITVDYIFNIEFCT